MNPLRRELLLALAGAAVCPRVLAQADEYPSKAIRLIVPFAPGGGTDIVARILGQKIGEAWKQAVVVDNRAGANGTIGAHLAAKSPPDGYTLTMMTASHSVNVTLQGTKHPYDLLKDFAPVSQVTRQPYVLVVNPNLPAKSVKELLALARSQPGKLTYGSSGIGGTSHLAGALLGVLGDAQLTHIPYRGGEPAMTAVVGGQIDMLFSTLLQSRGLIQGGKLRPLAVTTPSRSAAIPEMPTMQEAGVPRYEVVGWYGLLAPAGTPPAIVQKLNREIVRSLRLPDVGEKIAAEGSEPVGNSPEEFGAHIKAEVEKWRDLIQKTGIKTES
ncbi:MAG TPA: tripartite tricarboxylate transporter substrate binding protein [Burkholderiales bacterium]|nr:tripartite tricarboxylate transporter substrate binding protein [Burkholderiales bacterium]